MMNVSIPSEFDLQMRSERGRWLRWRFLWLCAVGCIATLLLQGNQIYHHFTNGLPVQRLAGWFEVIECVVVVSIYATAWLYARRRAFVVSTVPRLAFGLVVAVAGVELASGRLELNTIDPAEWNDPNVTAATVATAIGLVTLFVEFFFACLFIPWTTREALGPAGVLIAMYAVLVLVDIVTGRLIAGALLVIPTLAVSFLPGLAICWWRHSRFRKFFRLRFESAGYHVLQTELASARRFHESCLPQQVTDGPIRLHYAYEPMRQIGGDLLFVNTRANGSDILNVVVLDVTGHGVAAALTVNRMFGELERLFAETPDASPEMILRSLNRYVSLTLSRHGIYATALCIRVDAQTGELDWANGGHPPAFVRRADGRMETLEPTATMLGVLDGADFCQESCRMTLNTGDVVLAYTDGVSEAANPTGEQLSTRGVERLTSEVFRQSQSFHDCPQSILNGVLNYRQSPVEDDTLVVVIFRAAEAQTPIAGPADSPILMNVISS